MASFYPARKKFIPFLLSKMVPLRLSFSQINLNGCLSSSLSSKSTNRYPAIFTISLFSITNPQYHFTNDKSLLFEEISSDKFSKNSFRGISLHCSPLLGSPFRSILIDTVLCFCSSSPRINIYAGRIFLCIRIFFPIVASESSTDTLTPISAKDFSTSLAYFFLFF